MCDFEISLQLFFSKRIRRQCKVHMIILYCYMHSVRQINNQTYFKKANSPPCAKICPDQSLEQNLQLCSSYTLNVSSLTSHQNTNVAKFGLTFLFSKNVDPGGKCFAPLTNNVLCFLRFCGWHRANKSWSFFLFFLYANKMFIHTKYLICLGFCSWHGSHPISKPTMIVPKSTQIPYLFHDRVQL